MILSVNIIVRLAVTLSIGALGGWVMYQFRFPLAWMLGAMIATTIVALAGKELQAPIKLKTVMMAVVGVMLGSNFTPDVFESIASWLNTIFTITIFVCIVPAIGYLVLKNIFKFDRPTSFFSSIPGGLTEMIMTGGAMGGDERTIALNHAVRIMMTVLIIPFWFRLTGDFAPVAFIKNTVSLTDVAIMDMVLLAIVGIAGVFIGKLLRIPAFPIIGPMIASAAVHLFGITEAEPPIELINVAQIVIGASLGCRFNGTSIRDIPLALISGAVTGIYMVALAAIVASVLSPLTGISFAALWLAFAPGGLPEMTLMSLALGVDPAFVTAHHLYRVILLVILAPAFYKLIDGILNKRNQTDP